MLSDLMKPKAHGHTFCSSLMLAVWYKTQVSQFTREHTIIASNEKDSISKCEESETVEKQPVFDVETTAFHYTRALENYQQRIAARQAAYTSVTETAIHSRRQETT